MAKYLTREKFEELKKELEYLKTVKRKEIANLIRYTASFGDLRENFAYQEAKEEQAFLERRIRELEEILSQAEIIENKKSNVVEIGSTVYLKKIDDNKEEKYQIVDPAEANPLNGKISFQSPLGKEILGKKAGEIVTIKTPTGTVQYKITKIE